MPKNVTLVRWLQAANALFPILVTLLGIVTLVRPVQPLNAAYPIPILMTLLGIVTLVRAMQLANALSPILVETTVPPVAAAFDAVAKAAEGRVKAVSSVPPESVLIVERVGGLS